jgi:glutaminyl-tRNA synthetase
MAICLDFGVAAETGGRTYLRLDDTNPGKESPEFVEAIKDDVHWLGFDWEDRLTHASDYFDRLYESAIQLIEQGVAYVDSLSAEEIREHRGTLTEPGKNSPYRDRSVEENLDLFRRMYAGEFGDGEHVLRAKIDMASPNMNMRDPAIYRIRHIPHQNAGDKWCMHARVRGPPTALRLVPRPVAARASSAPDRILTAEPRLHDYEQAQAQGTR